MGYQSAKKALNAYPHTSTEASGHFPIESRSVNPKNVRNWAQNWPQRPPRASCATLSIGIPSRWYLTIIKILSQELHFWPQKFIFWPN